MKNTNWRGKNTEELISVILSLKNKEQATNFLRDLMTESEIIEMGNRWKAAQMLYRGLPYKDIVEKTGLSSRTVARIKHWLSEGMGGYQFALRRVKKTGVE